MARSSLQAMKKDPQKSTPSTVVLKTSIAAPEPSAPEQGGAEARIAAANRDDLIRQAAYRRFKERGTPHGDEVQDWLEAEAEINQSLVE